MAGDAAGGQWAVAATYSYSPLGWNSSIDLNPGVIYYKSPGTTVWTSTGVDAFKVHGISGSGSFFSLKRNTPISEYLETADQINYRASSLAPIVDISYNLVGERFIAISSDGDDMLYVLVKTGEFDGYNIGTIYKKTLSATSWTSTGITGVLSMAAVPYTPAQAGKIAYATYTAISSTGSCAYIAMNDGTSVTNYGHPTTNYYTLDNVTPIYNEAGNIELWARRGLSMRKSSTPGTWMATGVNDMRGVASTSGKILMTIMQDGSNSVLIPRRIFTKSQTGVWFDDERVRTAEMANTVTFNVTPGTYTITQNAVTGWHLTDITVDETTTAGTSINKVTKSVTVTVSDKELVMIEFENQVTETSITTLSNICGEEGFVEDFSSYKNGNWGNPVEGMISYHKATSSFGYGHYAVMSTIYPTMHYGVSGMYDHTEGDTTGAMLVVDATFEPGTFYRRSFTGLIAGGKYSMGAWITNYNPPAGDKPNVSFEIYSVATGNLLASASSGNVLTSDWHNFNLIYESDGSDIEIVLRNNTPGTAGNDLAIDDISLSLTPLAPVAAVTSYDCISGATLEVTAPIAIGSLSYEYSIDGTNWQTSPTFTGLAAIAYNVQARYAGSSTGSCVSSTPVTISNAGCISVLGNVFNDPDGGNVNNSTGGPNNIPSGIYANLVDDDGEVVASVLVNTNGSYGFTGVAAGSGYTVQLSNVEGTIGTPPPAFTAPTGWIVTGAYNGTPNTGNTGVLTGTSAAFTVASTNVENINFGIKPLSLPPAFPCNNSAYITYGPNTGVSLYSFDLVNGTVGSAIYNTGTLANCLAYNPLDNLLYMLVTPSPFPLNKGELVVVGSDGTHQTLTVPHLADALGINPTTGGITTNGYYVVNTTASGSNRYVTIDLDATRPTYLQIVDPQNGYIVAASPYYTTASANLTISDWAYNLTDGLFYGLTNAGNIATLDIETGVYSVGSVITLYDGTTPGSATYGATYIDATGKLYVTSNDGISYSIDITTNKVLNVSTLFSNQNFDGANCPDAVFAYTIAGNVFNDANGMTDGIVNGTSTNVGGTIYATLYNTTTGEVVASVPVAANGTYAFSVAPSTDEYSIYIGDEEATVGASALPSTDLPTGYENTGEQNCMKTPGCTGNDGTPNGVIVLSTVTGDITQANFGIQELPETVVNVADPVITPAPGTSLSVDPTLFTDATNPSNPSTEDYSGGTVDNIRITEFPTGVDSITIGSTTYTSSTFPAGGVVVDYTPGTGVTGVAVFPSNGANEVVIPIAAIDNAGGEDPTPGSITIPLNTISVSGNVFNDANGGNVNPTETPNSVPSGLYANLIDNAGNVVATVPVNTDGTYDFTRVQPGDYTVMLSTNDDATNTSEIVYNLPTGWANTGAYNGTPNSGNTGILTGTSSVFTITNVDVNNINFGIEQISTSDVKSYTLPTQPIVDDEISLSGLSGAPIMSGTDPEDGTYTGNTGTQNNPTGVVITSLPTHGELLYNGTLVTSTDVTDGTVFPDPSLFTVKLTGSGYDSTKFDYAYVDAAGITGTSNTYTLTWESPLPIRLLSFEAIAKGNTAVLTWTTASEQNNKGFEVERSTDGSNWESIGFVATLANEGNSTAPLDYTYSDNAPLQGTNFYRLKQVDINGKYEYSGVRTVNFAAQSSIVLSPNPTSGIINISGLSKGNNQIVVTNAIGQQILNTNITNQSTYNIDLHRFVSGVYYISINNESGIISNHKVVKQ